jgi:hypothetical protein
MMFENDNEEPSFLRSIILAPPHYAVKNEKNIIEQITKEISEMTK